MNDGDRDVKKGSRHTPESRELISYQRREQERLYRIMGHELFERLCEPTVSFEERVAILMEMGDIDEHEARASELDIQDQLVAAGHSRQPM